MNSIDPRTSSIALIGIGGAGCGAVSAISAAYGPGIRALAIDTDARSASAECPFMLIGGQRLGGNGAGGSVADAGIAARDDIASIDSRLVGVRVAVLVAGLGGGTGGGATAEILKHLGSIGVTTLLFATTPFSFEGEESRKRAESARPVIEDSADTSAILPLDALVAGGEDLTMGEALRQAIDTIAAGVTLLWRMIERPGYLKLDAERLRRLVAEGGPARFAVASAVGPDRAQKTVESLRSSPLLVAKGSERTRAILVGVLSGDDLRLSEVGAVANELSFAFGPSAALSLGTVNDEQNFAGRLTTVALLFGEGRRGHPKAEVRRREPRPGTVSRGADRFRDTEKTDWRRAALDSPTYLRRGLSLER